jgi:hypothetical protein
MAILIRIDYDPRVHKLGTLFDAVIGKVIRDYPSQRFDKINQFTVHVERLDSILIPKDMKIGLLKMDVQGFECRALEGMGDDVAGIIDVMKFEYSRTWLNELGCFDLIPRLMNSFDIYKNIHGGVFSGLMNSVDVEVIANTHSGFDLFASKRVVS